MSVATRTTKAGVPCRLPLFYENALITDCTVLPGGGSVPSCFALGDIGPQPCAPPKPGSPSTPLRERLAAGGPGDGAMGSLCRSTNPAGASDCQAGFICAPMPAGPLANSPTYGYCAGGGTAEGDGKNETEGEGGGLEAVPVASRTTVDGRACRLPLVVNGSLLTDCGAIGGKTACYVAPDDAADAGGALAFTAECAEKQGSWATAPLADVLAAGSAAGLDGRAGALCALALPGAPGRPATSLTCSPGLTCTRVDAGPLKNAPYGTCLASKTGPGAAAPKKPAAAPSIADRKPAPVSGAGLGIMPVAARVTADGAACRLPVVMSDGTMFTDCGPLGGVSGGVSACYTAGLKEWGACAPRNASTPPALPLAALLASGRGADGQRGSICAADASAVPAPLCDSGLTCRPLSGPYGFCAGPKDPVVEAVPPAVDTGAADAEEAKQRVAAALAADNSTSGLASRTVAQRMTVAGLPCRLPVRYKGKVLTDCAKIGDNFDHCFVGEGFASHQKCRATAELPDAPSIAQMELDGKLGDGSEGALCVLAEMAAGGGGGGGDAFAAGSGRGATCRAGLKCVPGSSAPLRGSRYGYCKAPAAAASAVDAVLHPKKHKEAKKAAADAALTPAQQAVADLAVADRVTAAGERCRLPAVVNGTLVTDCFAWPGYLPGDDEATPPAAPAGASLVAPAVPAEGGAGACFTPASPTVPQRCARTGGPGGYSLSPLSALLALPGRAADAGPGALCTLDADTAARIAPGAAALPPCGAGTAGCAVLRPGGQLKASGLGFCLAIDGSDPAAGGAGGPAGAGLDKPVEVPGGASYLPTGEEAVAPAASARGAGRQGPHCGPICMWGSAFAMVLSALLIGGVCYLAFCRPRPTRSGQTWRPGTMVGMGGCEIRGRVVLRLREEKKTMKSGERGGGASCMKKNNSFAFIAYKNYSFHTSSNRRCAPRSWLEARRAPPPPPASGVTSVTVHAFLARAQNRLSVFHRRTWARRTRRVPAAPNSASVVSRGSNREGS